VVYTTVQDDNGDLIGFSAVTRDQLTASALKMSCKDSTPRCKNIAEQTEELIRTIASGSDCTRNFQAQKWKASGPRRGIAHDFNNL
jgi:hypothetical protein